MTRPTISNNARRVKQVNPKTRLKVVHGDVDSAELVLLEDEDQKQKTLGVDATGVEHEDAHVRCR